MKHNINERNYFITNYFITLSWSQSIGAFLGSTSYEDLGYFNDNLKKNFAKGIPQNFGRKNMYRNKAPLECGNIIDKRWPL